MSSGEGRQVDNRIKQVLNTPLFLNAVPQITGNNFIEMVALAQAGEAIRSSLIGS